MSKTILVKIKKRFYKVRINPAKKSHGVHALTKRLLKLRDIQARRKPGTQAYHRAGTLVARCRAKLMQKVRDNPLLKSPAKKAIGGNINYLLKHPEELTAKTPEMRRKQAIAIALSVWRKASGKKRRK